MGMKEAVIEASRILSGTFSYEDPALNVTAKISKLQYEQIVVLGGKGSSSIITGKAERIVPF
jgi:hypothetical protein